MRRPAIRRFPDNIVRRRQGPATENFYGERVPGAIVETALPASIQPVKLEDIDTEGGAMLSARLMVYVPTGVQRAAGIGDILTWNGRQLLWGGEPLEWGGISGLTAGDENPLVAAFDDTGADEVQIGADVFVVEESVLWSGSHCRATLLRQT